jgi:hypothetical protein
MRARKADKEDKSVLALTLKHPHVDTEACEKNQEGDYKDFVQERNARLMQHKHQYDANSHEHQTYIALHAPVSDLNGNAYKKYYEQTTDIFRFKHAASEQEVTTPY